MTTIFLILGKLLASSAMLYAFYWLVLRNRATYRLARLYLLLIPAVGLMMSLVSIPVYTVEEGSFMANASAVIPDIDHPQVTAPGVSVPLADAPIPQTVVTPMTTAADAAPVVRRTWSREMLLGWMLWLGAAVSVILVLFAVYHFTRLWLLGRRMARQVTPEGYGLVRSARVQSPCSFARTIFLPMTLEGRDAEMILRHEKAHIAHGHFIDVVANELATRLLWFNPFLWLVRKELRNVHEFEADHDVLACGADISAYQTLLLAQVMAGGNDFANGFTHSFIRRRFIEMKRSTAGTLGKIGKLGLVAWVAGLFCIFTFSECEPSANAPMTWSELREVLATIDLDEPQMFVLDGTVDEAITDSCYNIYLSDEFLRIQGDTPVTCVPVVDKRFTFSLPLKRLTAGRLRCIFPGGELCSAWIDIFFTPGDTLRLTVHNGYYSTEYSKSYNNNVKRWVGEMRRVTHWQSPEQPQVEGRRWTNVHNERHLSPIRIKDVVFGADETVLHITTDEYMNGIGQLPDSAYLTDAAGNIYRYRPEPIEGDTHPNNRLRNVFGAYYSFEPLPDTVTTFDFHLPMRHPMTGYNFVNVIRNIHEVVANASADGKWYQATAMPAHPSVDLGLSVKWATMNIGANKPEDFGDYFAWGETSAKDTYSIANYKHVNPADSTLTKYCINAEYGKVDGRVLLDEIDDAAANWGGWRMPTFQEWYELMTECTWESTTQNGVKGKLVTGPNGNSIFLPIGGCRYDGENANIMTQIYAEVGMYWYGDLEPHQQASGSPNRGLSTGYIVVREKYESGAFGAISRFAGLNVRAVCDN